MASVGSLNCCPWVPLAAEKGMKHQLGLPRSDLPFDELAALRDLAKQLLDVSDASLTHYRDELSGGYFHVLDKDFRDDGTSEKNSPGDYSKASTATVVRYLVVTGSRQDASRLNDNGTLVGKLSADAQQLFDRILRERKWASAGLNTDNPFTVGFMLEFANDLRSLGAHAGGRQRMKLTRKLDLLRKALVDGRGSIAIESGLPNAYSTQLVVRVLRTWDDAREPTDSGAPRFDDAARELTRTWAMAAVDAEIALHASAPDEFDIFELGYAVLLVLGSSPPDPSPSERRRLRKALDLVFEAQSEHGTWPQSRRLFHYPTYGNAYCYEYEFLTQLLDGIDDPLLLRPYLRHFRRAIDRLGVECVHLPEQGLGWMSGHHRQLRWPESWSTASCFHFTHLLDRFVAGVIRDSILHHLDARPSLTSSSPNPEIFDGILDSSFELATKELSLKDILNSKLVRPVYKQREALRNGGELDGETPLSAILYGPPGTSKTKYVHAIAAKIGWTLISIDPSHLMRKGIGEIFPETSQVFRMLNYADNVVVLFDEIDELVRERTGGFEESTSRFLTTAMLPKIAKLREGRKLLFFVATNHLEIFDAAISRHGRFDIIVPVMPPTLEEKIRNWNMETTDLWEWIANDNDMKRQIESLTYAEFDNVAETLKEHLEERDEKAFKERLFLAYESCLLCSTVEDAKTWNDQMEDQKRKIRVP